jgi:hypothetical protein
MCCSIFNIFGEVGDRQRTVIDRKEKRLGASTRAQGHGQLLAPSEPSIKMFPILHSSQPGIVGYNCPGRSRSGLVLESWAVLDGHAGCELP